MPSFDQEHLICHKQHIRIAGIDEVGCGPWAGPLVASACILNTNLMPQDTLDLIQDSKKLTAKKRDTAFDMIHELSHDKNIADYGVGIVTVVELDTIGLSQSIRLAMERAIKTLSTVPEHLLIDGNRNPKFPIPTTMMIRGDSLSYSIAAASIMAKVTRDRIMKELHEAYPVYGWGTNAGYGTQKHMEALSQFGVTPHHRQSYAPIKRYMEREAA